MSVYFSPLINELIDALRCLPGVGPKSAQRMAMYLLQRNREGGVRLGNILLAAMDQIGCCQQCRIYSESPVCPICNNQARDKSIVCVVESPADVLAIENTAAFRGTYFVLHGHLSPIDGVGPEQLGLEQLVQLLHNDDIKEIILATNPTVEGEATAHYIAEMVRSLPIQVSRIAHGVPIGGELEFVDGGTLTRALAGRKTL